MANDNSIGQGLQQKIFSHASARQYNSYSQAVLKKLAGCHTKAIGRHHYQCNNSSCNYTHYQYHSCGNRHCINCGGIKKAQWIADRTNELLPTTYYHIVFTLPQQLRSIVMGNRKLLFTLLFEASHHTLTHLAANPTWLGAKPGIVSILHTNGQDLSFHPHVHCIVSGGGISKEGVWVKEKRSNGKFLFPRKKLEEVYKTYFIKGLQKLQKKGALQISNSINFAAILDEVNKLSWNVYAKAPFGGPAQIIEYLGRYTHKVAITRQRIVSITDTAISFRYKDYKDGHKQKIMELSHAEFLRRFEQNILPRGFVKIRHAGYLSHHKKLERINAILQQLQLPQAPSRVKVPITLLIQIQTGVDITLCPKCKQGKMECVATFINVGGRMVNISELQNKGSPKIHIQKPIA